MNATWVGRTLSKVQVERLVGRGGMADVYVGQHTTLNVPRAVKILHAHLTEDPDLQRRFREEAKAVASLRHPNIVQVYDFDLADGSPYIVMELLQGMSLAAYLKGLHDLGHSFPLETVARLIDRIAAALDYAHAQGIVHRDVKPANVILRQGATPLRPSMPLPPDCEPVLTDFGIARIAGTTQTLTGTILGTPAYMSPEQVRGEPVDARSDNYSLGIMLYEMLAGVLPFDPDVDTTASVLYKQANVAPPPLANTRPPIQAVVDKALQKDREARFQKAGDLASAFEHAVGAGAATVVSRKSPAQPPAPPSARAAARRPSALSIGIAAAALAAVLLTAAVILGWRALAGGSASPTAAPALAASTTSPQATSLAAAASTSAPANPTALPLSGPAVGGAVFQDSSLQAVIHDAPPLDATSAYGAWLTRSNGPSPIPGVDLSQGALSIAFVDPQGRNLLAVYDQFAISREPNPDAAPDVPGPLLYVSQAPGDMLVEIRRLDTLARGAGTTQSIIDGLRREAETHDGHLGFSLKAIDDGNLQGAKQHAEHTINVLVGEASPDFGDWDQNKRVENPGDGFGLLAYMRLALAMAESELANPDASSASKAALQPLVDELNAAIRVGEDSQALAQRIASADSIDEMKPLAQEWSTRLLAEGSATAAQQIEATGLRLYLPIVAAP